MSTLEDSYLVALCGPDDSTPLARQFDIAFDPESGAIVLSTVQYDPDTVDAEADCMLIAQFNPQLAPLQVCALLAMFAQASPVGGSLLDALTE